MPVRCIQTCIGIFDEQSDSNRNKYYYVEMRPGGRNTCTCIAFVMKRNKMGGLSAIGHPDCTCKHIKRVLRSRGGCGWDSEYGVLPKRVGECPECGSVTEPYVAPLEPTEENMSATLAALLSMARDLVE